MRLVLTFLILLMGLGCHSTLMKSTKASDVHQLLGEVATEIKGARKIANDLALDLQGIEKQVGEGQQLAKGADKDYGKLFASNQKLESKWYVRGGRLLEKLIWFVVIGIPILWTLLGFTGVFAAARGFVGISRFILNALPLSNIFASMARKK